MISEHSEPNDRENIANPEISEQDLINALLKGGRGPEAQKILNDYCDQEEKKVAELNTKEAPIDYNFRLGLIYIKSNLIEEGLFSLECALEQARNERLEELYYKIL